MSDSTELAVRQDNTPARHNLDREVTDSWIDVVQDVGKLAGYISDTEFVPKPLRGRTAAVAGVILYSREVGLPPMTGLAQTHVIEGKPSLSAEALRGLVFAAGHVIEFPETTGVRCVARGKRRGSETWTTVEWTIDQARAAGLLSKQNWKNHPRQMLQARASAELCRLIFPDVVHGMGAAEELLDDTDQDAAAETAPPTTTVRRAGTRRQAPAVTQVPQPSTPAPPKPESEPEPLEVDIEPPAGPARVETPGPAAAQPTREELDAENRLIRQTLEEGLLPPEENDPHAVEREIIHAEAIHAPERDRPATVTDLARADTRKVTAAQLRMLAVTWQKLGVTTDTDRRDCTAHLVGRELAGGTTKDLTVTEATRLIDTLTKLNENPDALDDLIRRTLADREGGED